MAADSDAIGALSTMCALSDVLGDTVIGDATVPAGAATNEVAGDDAADDDMVERYEVRCALGEGGMGHIDLLWDSDLRRDLAVKRLRKELRSDQTLLRQFLWEARVTASLDHPNVVPVHDLGVTPRGDVFFTMKYVRGKSLAEVIDRLRAHDADTEAAMSLARRLRLFLQLCQAVAFAHSRGVLHRDLKPANIMLGSHGELLLMDWGLAMSLPDSELADLAGELPERSGPSGTPLYMPPEQIDGAELDQRADVYSLGVILYELVALQPPFSGKSVGDIWHQVQAGEGKPLAEVVPQVSPSLAAVVANAMASDREQRYATATELLEDVERVIDGRTPLAEDVSLARKVARYAVHQDPRLASVRPYEIDLMYGGGLIAGAGIGGLVASHIAGWEVAMLVVGALMGMPFLIRWLRTLGER